LEFLSNYHETFFIQASFGLKKIFKCLNSSQIDDRIQTNAINVLHGLLHLRHLISKPPYLKFKDGLILHCMEKQGMQRVWGKKDEEEGKATNYLQWVQAGCFYMVFIMAFLWSYNIYMCVGVCALAIFLGFFVV